MWSAATRPMGILLVRRRKPGQAVEKTGPWKRWKTINRFPTAPTVPWKSRKAGGIPTFPPLRRRLYRLKRKHANPLRQAEGERQGKSAEPDRSRVNKSGQIDKLPTPPPCQGWGIFDWNFGEFSTGTLGNFQPVLTFPSPSTPDAPHTLLDETEKFFGVKLFVRLSNSGAQVRTLVHRSDSSL